MKNITYMYHLVHIGYDKENQPELTNNIKKRIALISDNVSSILNFVDEQQEPQIYKLADFLKYFIKCIFINKKEKKKAIKYVYKHHYKNKEFFENKELFDYLKKLIIKEFENLRGDKQTPVTQEIIYKKIMGEKFLDILKLLMEYFDTTTPFETKYVNPANLERREELMKFAEDLLGKDRIITSGMIDGEINRVISLFLDIGKNEIYKLKYGNAHYLLQDTMENKLQELSDALEKNNYEISDTTKHIIGGEYFGKCVKSYEKILCLYFSRKNIQTDLSISLLHPNYYKYLLGKGEQLESWDF